MSQIVLESTTIDSINALKVDLATKLAGEQPASPRDWLETNSQGYLNVKGAIVSLSTGAAVWLGLGIATEVISVYNPGPLRIWVRADRTAATADYPSIPVEPGLSVTIPARTPIASHIGGEQISIVAASAPSPAMEVSVMGAGNAT